MASVLLKDCKTAADVRANYRAVRARLYSAPRAISVTCEPPPPPTRLRIEAAPPPRPAPRPAPPPPPAQPIEFDAPPLQASDITAIVFMVADDFSMKACDLTGSGLNSRVVRARFIAVYLVRYFTHASNRILGREFRRDHSSIVYARRRMATRLRKDARLARLVEVSRDRIACWFHIAPPAGRPHREEALSNESRASAAQHLRSEANGTAAARADHRSPAAG